MGLHREEPVKWSHVSAVFVFSLEAGFLEAEKIITALILSSVQILSKFFSVFFFRWVFCNENWKFVVVTQLSSACRKWLESHSLVTCSELYRKVVIEMYF